VRLAFHADGSRLLVGTKTRSVLRDVHLESRDATPIDAFVKQLPWKLERGVVVPK